MYPSLEIDMDGELEKLKVRRLDITPFNSVCFGVCDEFLAQGLHLKSHQRCSAGIRTWLSADQSSSSTLTESSFLFDPCLIHRDTVVLE